MTTKTKRKYAKVLAAAVATTMAASMCMTSLAAFAKADLSTTKKYTNPYATLADALKASGEVNEQIEAEGIVLLKNKTANNAAPLAKGAKVTVLGSASLNPSYGGAGSGSIKRPGRDARDWEYVSETATDVYTGLEKGGALVTNAAVKTAYGKVTAATETGTYMQLVTEGEDVTYAGKKYKSLASGGTLQSVNNYAEYNTAIVVITRSGSEFYDNAAYNVPGHTDKTDHYLELDDKECELMAYAKKNFNKVIVLLNGPSALEVGDMKNDDKIDAIYWVGQPGWNGFNVLGKVLTGEINPSGRLVDEWFTRFEYDPVWYNWGSYGQAELLLKGSTERETGTRSSTTLMMGLPSTSELTTTNQDHVMDYAEGIYLGYRYAETVYEDMAKTDKAAADAWYSKTVAYPFGYGLSYTSFEKKITEITGDLSNKDGEVTVKVSVKNTGAVAGKDVVQIYSSAPYTQGGIEKAACDLVGFEKTSVIAAGETETVTVKFAVKDLAAFDYNDANRNGYSGYELEQGTYKISVRSDSHTVDDTRELSAATTLKDWDEDGNSATVNNIFSQTTGNWEMYNTLAYHWTVSGDNHYITRGTTDEDSTNLSLTEFAAAAENVLGTDATKQAAAKTQLLNKLSWLFTDDNSFSDKAINSRHQQFGADNDPYHDWDNPMTIAVETDYTNPWTKTYADLPAGWTQATKVGTDRIQAYTLLGEPMYLADGTENPKWTAFMNQFTYEELALHGESGSFSTPAQDSVGLPKTADKDGPAQMGSGWTWTCEVVIASTWNKELAHQQGLQNGYESMLQDTNGWYGPAANNHRSPLSGRNFEYYSQDGVQGGLMAAEIIRGATDLGVHVYLKHAFMNDQETQRYGMATFATEQAIRLIYAKPWELAMKLGNLNGTMSAFNNVGNSSSGSYAVMIQLYENEWGFDGYSVTDMYGGEGGSYFNMWSMAQLARGHNMPLGNVLNNGKPNKDAGVWSATANNNKGGVIVKSSASATTEDKESPTQWYWVRTTAMHMMYTQVNGNAMNNGFNLNIAKGVKAITTDINVYVNEQLVNLDALDEYFGAGGYKVTVTIPDSLKGKFTYDATTGMISGLSDAITHREVAGWRGTTIYNYEEVTVAVNSTKSSEEWVGGTYTIRLTVASIDQLLSNVSQLQTNITNLQNQIKELQGKLDAAGKTITGIAETETGFTITFSDGSTIALKNGADGAPGKDGADGAPGKDGKGGCGSTIAIGVPVAGAFMLICAAVVAKKLLSRKEN